MINYLVKKEFEDNKKRDKVVPFLLSWLAITLLFLAFDNSIVYELTNLWVHFQFPLKAIIYAGSFALSSLVILVLSLSNNKIFSITILILSSILIYINQVYKSLNGSGISYEEILIVLQNFGFGLGEQIFYTYYPYILKPLIFPTGFIILIILVRNIVGLNSLSSKSLIPITLLGIVSNFAILDYSNGIRSSFPSPLKIPSLLLYTSTNKLYYGEKNKVNVTPINTTVFDHIVWIIDESVRGDKLSINDTTLHTTPFLQSVSNHNLINLGIASSGAVCSDYSHMILMSGVQPNQIPDNKDYIRKTPSIFQFAEAAGYKTNLIYSPGYEDKPKGFLTEYDFEYIENRYNTKLLNPDLEEYKFDFKSIEELMKILKHQPKSFSYFLKYGCHFHYETAYPPSQKHFYPTQEISDWKREDKSLLLNSYYNAVKWTVDNFFEVLFEKISNLENNKILIIYTSDHGQNLLEHEDIKLTHCIKTNAPSEMAAVPMILLSPNTKIIDSFINKVSFAPYSPNHFQVFPSTLMLMGYDSLYIKANYGSTFFDKNQAQNNYFFSGDIFGRSRCYKNIFDLTTGNN